MDLSNHKLPIVDKKLGEWWQEIGKQMKEFGFFDKGKPANVFWIFWKFREGAIMRAWHIAQKEDDHELSHLLNNIYSS